MSISFGDRCEFGRSGTGEVRTCGEFIRRETRATRPNAPWGASLSASRPPACRQHLANNPEKYEVQRGPDRIWLKLQDWFVPNLYQNGSDLPLPSAAFG
jgi:hypothetical protein